MINDLICIHHTDIEREHLACPVCATAATEKLTKENEELKRHLSSGICSAHQEPDPLNCSLCNQVVVLTNSNISMMEKIETLSARVKELEAIKNRAAKSLSELSSLSNINTETKRLLQTIAKRLQTL